MAIAICGRLGSESFHVAYEEGWRVFGSFTHLDSVDRLYDLFSEEKCYQDISPYMTILPFWVVLNR